MFTSIMIIWAVAAADFETSDAFSKSYTGMLFNTLRPRQNGCHFADDIIKHIFLNENV